MAAPGYRGIGLPALKAQCVTRNINLGTRTKKQHVLEALQAADKENGLRADADGRLPYENLRVVELRALLLNRGERLAGLTQKTQYIDQLRALNQQRDRDAAAAAAAAAVAPVAAAPVAAAPVAAAPVAPTPVAPGNDHEENGDENDVDATAAAGDGPGPTAPVTDEDVPIEAGEQMADATVPETGGNEGSSPFLEFVAEALDASKLPADETEDLKAALTSGYIDLEASGRETTLAYITEYRKRSATVRVLRADAEHLERAYVALNEYEDLETGNVAWADLRGRPTYFDYADTWFALCKALRKLLGATTDLRDAFEGIDMEDQAAQEAIDLVRQHIQTLLEDASEQKDDATEDYEQFTDRAQQEKYRKAITAEIRRRLGPTARSQLDSAWLGAWPVGKGAYGGVSLWVKQSSDYKIVDRLVVKDSFSPRVLGQVSAWDDSDLWAPQPSDPEKRVPTEVLALYMLRGREASECIVRIRNWRISTQDRFYRLFLEWCPHGDLATLARQHASDWEPIPEAFLWHVFESLATAGLLMQHGEREKNPMSGWVPIVHRDLKTLNVFLGNYSSNRFRSYPFPKLGDFGFAFFSRPSDDRDPADILNWGTPPGLAPEQANHILDGEKRVRPLSEKTNVWGIGHILWSLAMWQKNGRLDVKYDDPLRREPDFYADKRHLKKRYAGWYSNELIELIEWCTKYKPEDRPTFRNVLDGVRTGIDSCGYADLRTAAKGDEVWDDQSNLLSESWEGEYGSDKYALGLSVKNLKLPVDLQSLPEPPSDEESTEMAEDVPGGIPGAEIEEATSTSQVAEDMSSQRHSSEAGMSRSSRVGHTAAGAAEAKRGRKRRSGSLEDHRSPKKSSR